MQHVCDTQFAQCNISRIFIMISLRGVTEAKHNRNLFKKHKFLDVVLALPTFLLNSTGLYFSFLLWELWVEGNIILPVSWLFLREEGL